MKQNQPILIKLFIISFILLGTGFSIRKAESVGYSNSIIKKTKIIDNKLPYYPNSIAFPIGQKIDLVIQSSIKYKNFNGSVLVAKNNKILFEKTYGLADMKTKRELDKKSAFQLASVSKPFTATAILILVERKQLNLNDSIVEYFPQLPYPLINIQRKKILQKIALFVCITSLFLIEAVIQVSGVAGSNTGVYYVNEVDFRKVIYETKFHHVTSNIYCGNENILDFNFSNNNT